MMIQPTRRESGASGSWTTMERGYVGTGHLYLDRTSKFRYKQKSPAESPSCGSEEVPPPEEEGSGDANKGS